MDEPSEVYPVPASLDALIELDAEDFEAAFSALSDEQKASVARKLARVVAHQENQLQTITGIGAAFTESLKIEDLLKRVMEKITELMNAERSTLFVHDAEKGQLWSVVSQGVADTEIRLDVGTGVAGWVAETGECLRIDDAYQDDRFNPDVDSKTGFLTKSILCQPITSLDGELLGVVQVLNRLDGRFVSEDEQLLRAIAGQVAIALENSKLYTAIVEKNEALTELTTRLEERVAELDLLVDVESAIARASDLEEMAETLTEKTSAVFRAGAVILTLADGERAQVFGYEPAQSPSFRSEHQKKDFLGRTIVDDPRPIVCHADCDQVPDAVKAFVSFPIFSLIAVPLIGGSGECIGAIQAVYSADQNRFTTEELKVLTLIAAQISSAVVAQRHRRERERSNRMEMMGQMLSGVIHDLKNPIAVVSGYVQLMAMSKDEETRKEYVGTIRNQFDMLNAMTKELLDYAQGASTILRRKVFVGTFFDSFRELLNAELNSRGVELKLTLNYKAGVFLDSSKFQRAVLNLARNACDAMPVGGVFEITVSEESDNVRFDFADHGEGIPENVRDRLFEEFVTEGKADGTGLGLAIVKKIVDEHDGTISFESVLNEGTTFTVLLPKGRP